MAKLDRSDEDWHGDPERSKVREDQLTEDDVCKAIRNLKDRKGSTVTDIGKYLANEHDKFKNASKRQLSSYVKKAASKGMHNGRLTKSSNRFLLASNPSDAASSPGKEQGSSSKRNRRRRRKFKCRIRRSKRPYCSKYKRRCCKRKKKCRASVHRSKRPTCSRYKPRCCRRR